MKKILLIGSMLASMSLGAAHCTPNAAHASDAGEGDSGVTSASYVKVRAFPQVQGLTPQGTEHGVTVATRPDNVSCVQVNVTVLSAAALPVTALVIAKNETGQILNQWDPLVQTGCYSLDADATEIDITNLSTNTYRAQAVWGTR